MNQYLKIFGIMLTLYAIGIFYDKYNLGMQSNQDIQQYDIVKQFLLKNGSLGNSKNPIIWIHTTYEYNARNWKSFVSRGNTDLNQPYLLLTIKSIIDKCGGDFNVCLIDDNSFDKLIPGWNIDLNKVAKPIKNHLRSMAMVKVLYYYGGMMVPNSTLCINNLNDIYTQGVENSGCFAFENIARSNMAACSTYIPDATMIGCTKNNPVMKELVEYLEYLNSTDFTAEQDFVGNISKWASKKANLGELNLIDGKFIGIKKDNNDPVGLEDLLGEDYIGFYPNLYAIYIPANEILSRTKYQWFSRMSTEQILSSNLAITKYILGCN